MGQINDKTTQRTLEISKYPILVHKVWFYKLSQILRDKRIIGKNYVSLSDGIPLVPGHGDSVIIFKRENLIKKGLKLLKIEYNKEFFDNHPEIRSYVMEYKTEEEINRKIEGMHEFLTKREERLSKLISDWDKSKERMESIKKSELCSKIMNTKEYFLEMIKYEDEIITNSLFEFEFNDIEKILISSRVFERYCTIPIELENKIIYVEDYFPPTYHEPSPLSEWIKDRLSNEVLTRGGSEFLNRDLISSYQLVMALILHPEWETECHVITHLKLLQILPEKLDKIIRKISEIDYHDIEELVTYIVLTYGFTNSRFLFLEFENDLIERLNKKLGIL